MRRAAALSPCRAGDAWCRTDSWATRATRRKVMAPAARRQLGCQACGTQRRRFLHLASHCLRAVLARRAQGLGSGVARGWDRIPAYWTASPRFFLFFPPSPPAPLAPAQAVTPIAMCYSQLCAQTQATLQTWGGHLGSVMTAAWVAGSWPLAFCSVWLLRPLFSARPSCPNGCSTGRSPPPPAVPPGAGPAGSAAGCQVP